MKSGQCLWLLGVVLAVSGLCLTTGCDVGDDDDATPESGATLSSGSAVIGAHALKTAGVEIPGDGRMTAVVEWSASTIMTAYFKKSGPTNYGWVSGNSPLTSTVTGVSTGETYTFYIYNPSADDVNVEWTITFTPE